MFAGAGKTRISEIRLSCLSRQSLPISIDGKYQKPLREGSLHFPHTLETEEEQVKFNWIPRFEFMGIFLTELIVRLKKKPKALCLKPVPMSKSKNNSTLWCWVRGNTCQIRVGDIEEWERQLFGFQTPMEKIDYRWISCGAGLEHVSTMWELVVQGQEELSF